MVSHNYHAPSYRSSQTLQKNHCFPSEEEEYNLMVIKVKLPYYIHKASKPDWYQYRIKKPDVSGLKGK